MEVICIDGTFSQEQLNFFRLYGIALPQEGSLYSIRDVVQHTTGDVGVRLEEIVNPVTPCSHPVLGAVFLEPTFNIKRFSTLLGEKISESAVRELNLHLK